MCIAVSFESALFDVSMMAIISKPAMYLDFKVIYQSRMRHRDSK